MGLNCKKQVGKMKSIIVKVENDLEKERQLMKKKTKRSKENNDNGSNWYNWNDGQFWLQGKI